VRFSGWRPVLLVLLLLTTVSSVLRNGASEWRDAADRGKKLSLASEIADAAAGAAALVGIGLRKQWARPAAWVWVAVTTLTAGLAAAFWGDAPILAALAGAAATAALCGFAVWLALGPRARPAGGQA
jgi:hypothetical protein